MGKTQGLLIGGMLALLGVLALTFVVILVGGLGVGGSGSSHAAAYTVTPVQPTATPTPPPLSITPQQGWVAAQTHLAFTQGIAFAPSDPYVGYACGITQVGSGGALQFSRTADGGRTWHTFAPTQLAYPTCSLAVSPVNPHHILLTASTCYPVCYGGQTPDFLLSRDGGLTWQPFQVPTGDNTKVQLTSAIWAGDAILSTAKHFTQQVDGVTPTYQLAVSIAGAPLKWIDDSAFYATLGAHEQFSYTATALVAFGNTWEVRFQSNATTTCQSYGCTDVMQSTDQGATWQHFTVTSMYPDDIFAPPTGTTLYGTAERANQSYLVASSDSGHTWTTRLALPSWAVQTYTVLLCAPDGTIFLYGTTQQSNTLIVDVLAPQATAWQRVLTNVGSSASSYTITGLSWNAAGHSVALWGIQTRFAQLSFVGATAAYHAPTGA